MTSAYKMQFPFTTQKEIQKLGNASILKIYPRKVETDSKPS